MGDARVREDSKLEDLKKEYPGDNSTLEEIKEKKITPETQVEFFEIFKESKLFLPVTYSANMFEGIENAKEGDVFQPEVRKSRPYRLAGKGIEVCENLDNSIF